MLAAKIFLLVCLVLSICIGAAVYIYLHPSKKSVKEKKACADMEEKETGNGLKKLFQIKDVKNGIIKISASDYRTVFAVSSPDFELLTDEEQETFENSLMQFSLSLNFPVQFFTTTLKVETKEPAAVLDNVIQDDDEAVSDELREYAGRLKQKLYEMEREESYVRRSYCIVAVNGISDEKRALNELNNRMQTVFSGLKRCNMRVARLDTIKTLQLFHDIFNKGSNIKLEELINSENGGVLELYSQGIGGILNVEAG